MAGLLSRTKTSGPENHMGVLPVFVSQEAWVAHPWLDAGLQLWTGMGSLASKSGYLLPLPTEDLEPNPEARTLQRLRGLPKSPLEVPRYARGLGTTAT